MSKFTGKKKKGQPAISTAALPDIIFMLLFFFMVTTVMRTNDPQVKLELPAASEIEKLENKALVDYIFIGPPNDAQYGTAPRIQLDDAFAKVSDIGLYLDGKKKNRDEAVRNRVTTSLKVDGGVQMGIVTDVKQELRKEQALKINYSTLSRERTE